MATPNYINIIETHDIYTKNMQARHNLEIILLWSREDENCVGLKEHTLEFVYYIYGFPNVTTSIQRKYYNQTTYLKDSQRQAPRDSQIFNQFTIEERTHENILLIYVQ